MNRIIFPVVLSTAILCTASQPLAQGRGGGPKPKGTSAPVTHGGGSVSRGGGSATHGGGAAAQGGKTQHGPKTTHGGGHAKTTTGAPKTPKSTTSATTRTNTTTTKTTTTTTTTTTGTTLTAVQQKLQRNTNLAEKLQSRLPGGTDVIAAAADFRNLGQYVAAVNVSNNLGLDFAKLKTAMVEDGKSLGQAIQLQRSSVDGTTEALRAQREADILLSSTESSKPKATAKPKSTKDDRR
jgi:hypothetical protein